MRKLQVGAILSAAIVLSACVGSQQFLNLAVETFDQVPVYRQDQAATVLASIARNSGSDDGFWFGRGEICEVNTVANTLGSIDRESDGAGHLPYNQWEALFVKWSDEPVSRFLFSSPKPFDDGVSSHYNCWISIERTTYDAINTLLGVANALGISVDGNFNPDGQRVALTADDLREGLSSSSDSGLGIGRAVAGIATGAGIAAAVIEGVPPEDAMGLGMQVLGAIEGESSPAQSVGTSSGATGSSLPTSTSASPAQSGANGTCEIPGFFDGAVMSEAVIENLRLSWCPLDSTSQRRFFALQAELAWCRLNAEPPPENISQFLQTSRRTCDSLAALDESARTTISPGFGEVPAPYVRCRCPAHYFQ